MLIYMAVLAFVCIMCYTGMAKFRRESYGTKSFLKFSLIKIRTKMAIRATCLLITGLAGRFKPGPHSSGQCQSNSGEAFSQFILLFHKACRPCM
jgi:hypothetical protein